MTDPVAVLARLRELHERLSAEPVSESAAKIRNALPALLDVAEAAQVVETLLTANRYEWADHDKALVRLRAALARLGDLDG